MSDKEDDLGEKSRRSRKRGQGMSSQRPAVPEIALNLSEEESSDEEIPVNVKPSNDSEKASSEIVHDSPSVSNIQTSYDFTKIMKSQAELVEARDRFNSSLARLENELDIHPGENLPMITDNYTVEELLDIGERDTVRINNYNLKPSTSSAPPEFPLTEVEITLHGNIADKEQRRQKNKELALTKHLNQVRRELQKEMHKVHLLCLIAHGNYISSVINSDHLYGCALSFLPKECSPPPLVTISYILKLLKWFGVQFPLKKHKKTRSFSVDKLEEIFTTFKPCSVRDAVILFVSLLRGLSITARIVINFNPVPLKIKKVGWTPRDSPMRPLLNPTSNLTGDKKHKNRQGKAADKGIFLDPNLLNQPGPSHMQLGPKSITNVKSTEPIPGKKSSSKRLSKKISSTGPKKPTGQGEGEISEAGPSKKKISERDIAEAGPSKKKVGERDIAEAGPSKKNHHEKSYKQYSSKPGSSKSSDETSGMVAKAKPSEKHKSKQKLAIQCDEELSSAHVGGYTKPEKVVKCLLMGSSSSSEDELVEEPETTSKCGIDYWAEVFIENEERWVPVDLFSLKVDCPREIANRCTQPISYILGWKNDGSLKDVTKRYAAPWLTKKHRVEPEWWTKTLLPFLCKNYELDVMEEDQLNEILEKAPMPASISELKNHPLFVLPRHLHKYEAIYPRNSAPLGYVKGEPVFSRYCVQTLMSKEKWFQQGKSIRFGALPYKMVNSRSKSGKFKGNDNKLMELYGSWQVTDYIPPPVVNGKIPVNEYGNVELYKPSMLPAGAVHIQVPGLMKIAQKLNIDCAHAVIGWQHHNGVSHPLIDGVVIAKEYQDVLLDAWNSDIDFTENRFTMRRKARAKLNWLKICKSVLIKEHLKKKYRFGEESKYDDGPLPKQPKKEN